MSFPSDLNGRPTVVLEIPNFGYGPASAALAVAGHVADQYNWHIVSAGGAADFAARQLPGALRHELDTNFPDRWPGFTDIVPPGSVVVTFTNPEFAAWAVQHGYRVGLIDTLDWMWSTLPATVPAALSGTEFHMIQEYFAIPAGPVSGRRDIVRPIVDQALWGRESMTPARSGTAMISFGGMQLPYGNEVVAEYVRWFLGAVLPIVIEQAQVTRLTIVGGRPDLGALVPRSWARHPAVSVHVSLDRAAYAALARGSEHVLITPGLAQVYECAVAGLDPLIQPGFGMSMVLQAHHVALTGYPHMYTWPWLPEVAPTIAAMSEPEGMQYADKRMLATIREDPDGQDLGKAVTTYLAREPGSALLLPANPALPDAARLFAAHLARLSTSPSRSH
jgi:hypothetical protein